MKKVYSRQEARDWFLEHSSGSVICVSVIDRSEQVASCFPVADKFYQQNALLNKYRSVRSVSVEELIELEADCDKLGISIHKALPNIWKDDEKMFGLPAKLQGPSKKTPIDEKSHFSYGRETAIKDKYNELIMAVKSKNPRETRHQTALRHITVGERSCTKQGKSK